eukprot:jgi/Tetstr1/436262/TSEL_025104.t1
MGGASLRAAVATKWLGANRLDARLGLSPDSRMQRIEEADPELECESGGRDGEGGSDEDEVQHSDGLRDCCVLGFKVGTLIDSTRRPLSAGSMPRSQTSRQQAVLAILAQLRLHAPQRREDSGGEREGEDGGDDSDAWLETERQKKENALPDALKPKASWRGPLKIAWVDDVDITNKRKKPPKDFTKLQQERWYEGRAALRKYRNALRSKRAREQKKSGKAIGDEVCPSRGCT